MCGITRKLRRARLGKAKFEEMFPRPEQRYDPLPDGGYVVFHPTRGARRHSMKRLRAQFRLAQALEM